MSIRNLTTDFNVSPYFDDNEEQKKFLRILFRPSFPVQARELTQLQSILNTQISRIGESIFNDGSLVTGGEFSLSDARYIRLDNNISWEQLSVLVTPKSLGQNYAVNDELFIRFGQERVLVSLGLGESFSFALINNVVPTGFFGKVFTENFRVASGASGAQFEVNTKITTVISEPGEEEEVDDDREDAPIFHVTGFTTSTDADEPTLFGEYLTGTEFRPGDELFLLDKNDNITSTSLGIIPDFSEDVEKQFSGDALLSSIAESVFFTNGFFVLVDQQTIPLQKYNNNINARVGLDVIEEIVTERDDNTLLDNAAGSPNENAPGAHRFRILLLLSFRERLVTREDFENESFENFYSIADIENGELKERRSRPNFSVIGDEMARNIFDINGNFNVKPFLLSFEDKVVFTITEFVSYSNENTFRVKTDLNVDVTTFKNKRFKVRDISYEIAEDATIPGDALPGQNEYNIKLNTPPDLDNSENIWIRNQILSATNVEVIDVDFFAGNLSSGNSFVGGRNFRKTSTTRIDIEKTTTDRHVITENRSTSINFGNYLVFENDTSEKLLQTDLDYGNIIQFFSVLDNAIGSPEVIGESYLKQLRPIPNDRLELYFFEPRFKSYTIASIDGTIDTNKITSNNIKDWHLGSVFTFENVRYRIVGVDENTSPNEATLDTKLVSSISNQTITVVFNANNVRSFAYKDDLSKKFKISETVQFDFNEDGYVDTRVLDTERNKLYFTLSRNQIKSLSDVRYRYYKSQFGNVESNEITVNTGPNEELHVNPNDYLIQLGDNSFVTPVNININDNKIILSGVADETGVTVLYPVNRIQSNEINLTYRFGNIETIEVATPTSTNTARVSKVNGQVRIKSGEEITTGSYVSIGLVDVVKLRIFELDVDGSVGESIIANREITNRFDIDFGQYDDIVEQCRIRYKVGFSPVANDILIVADRFVSSGSDPNVFYSVDSYDSVFYPELPSFRDSSDELVDRRTIVDFRPRISEVDDGEINLGNKTSFDEKSFNTLVRIPVSSPDNRLTSSTDYYVGRFDKIIITDEPELRVLSGIPGEDYPVNDNERSLTLYDIEIEPFSFTKDKVETTIYDNNRHTMSDISDIDKRLKTVERSIQLERVEREILSVDVNDKNNENLFKTGFLVDSFRNFNVANVDNEDFKAALDVTEGDMRPSFDIFDFSAEQTEGTVPSGSSLAKITEDGIIMSNYNDNAPVLVAEQIVATSREVVNPFAVTDWLGEIHLTPERDFWKDVVRKPDQITKDNNNDAIRAARQSVAGRVEWNNWETKWTSVKKTVRTGLFGRRKKTVTRNVATGQERTGVRTVVDTKLETKSLGDRVLDQSEIAIMRPVPGGIRFKAFDLRPSINVFPFFDDRLILNNVRPGVIVRFDLGAGNNRGVFNSANIYSNNTLVMNNGTFTNVLLTHKSKNTTHGFFHFVPTTNINNFYDAVSVTSVTNLTGPFSLTRQRVVIVGGTSNRLRTDPLGCVSGIFDVPAGVFKTGKRSFKLVDDISGNFANSTTNADVDFDSSGIKEIVQEQLVTTRVPVFRRETVKETSPNIGFGSTIGRISIGVR